MNRRDKFFGYVRTLKNYLCTDKARHDFFDYVRAVINISITTLTVMIILSGGIKLKLGVMGGTFDPIHFGHLAMAESAREAFKLDEILFVPSARPPHKVGRQIAGEPHRLMMTFLATKSNSKFNVSPMEMLREGFSYTLDTVEELHRKFGDNTELFFIIGSDSMADLYKWHKAHELIHKANFLFAARPGINLDFNDIINTFGEDAVNHIHQFSTPALEISSSDIRERVKLGKSIKYLTPEVVENYIYKERLYQI